MILYGDPASSGIVIKNNLAYGSGNTKDGATNGSAATFIVASNATNGINYIISSNSTNAQTHAINPFVATSPVSVLNFTPIGYALGGGTDVPVWDDFYLTPQSAGYSI